MQISMKSFAISVTLKNATG